MGREKKKLKREWDERIAKFEKSRNDRQEKREEKGARKTGKKAVINLLLRRNELVLRMGGLLN